MVNKLSTGKILPLKFTFQKTPESFSSCIGCKGQQACGRYCKVLPSLLDA
jgi:hypothetical protein